MRSSLPKLSRKQIAQILGDPIPLAIAGKRQQTPGRLTTLWEIVNTLNAIKFARTWELLQNIKSRAESAATANAASFYDGDSAQLDGLAEQLRQVCKSLNTEISFHQMQNLEDRLEFGPPYLNREIGAFLCAMDEKTMLDLNAMIFVQIPSGKAGYFNQDMPFGEAVHKAFPAAQDEIKEAGNCLALDLNTAAVFHLTRAAEVVLLDVAKRCRIKKTANGNDIDSACWGEVIGAILEYFGPEIKRLGTMKGGPRTKAKTVRLRRYERTSLHLREIKNLWRDPASHGVEVFTEYKAKEAYGHIRGFMIDASAKRTIGF